MDFGLEQVPNSIYPRGKGRSLHDQRRVGAGSPESYPDLRLQVLPLFSCPLFCRFSGRLSFEICHFLRGCIGNLSPIEPSGCCLARGQVDDLVCYVLMGSRGVRLDPRYRRLRVRLPRG